MKQTANPPGRKLLHNNTVSNTVNKKKRTLKKEEEVWITLNEDEYFLALLVWLLSDREVLLALLLMESLTLPVIRY